jgi:hypothetical protein
MSDLSALIARAIMMKRGNKEFDLSYYGKDPVWSASIGNDCEYVHIMENRPEFQAGSDIGPEDAVVKLIKLMEEHYAA